MRIVIVLSVLFCTVTTSQFMKWQIHEPIDLTWPVDENSIFWPSTKSFVYTRKVATTGEDEKWYAMNEFCMGEHVGTHIDAPYHFNKHGWKVADIPVERFLTHGIVVDMSEVVKKLGPTAELQEEDLLDWERINGPMPPHCVALIRFGWSEYYSNREKYLGMNGTHMVFPGIAGDAADWLVKSGKVVGVGIDTASVDDGLSTNYTAHRIMAKSNLYHLENVNIPAKLPARGFDLIVMPMKLKEGTGGPVRIMAIPEIILGAEAGCTPFDFYVNNVPWYGHTSVVLSSLLLLCMYAINCFTL